MSDKLEAVIAAIAQRVDIIRKQDSYSKQVGHAQQLGFKVEQHADAILASLRTPTPEQAGEVGTALGLDEDGMCDDHYQFGCPKCVAALRASTPPAQPTADAVERVCKVIAPDLFDEDQVTCHRAASPLRVDAAQGKVRDQARAILSTMSGDYVMVPREASELMLVRGYQAYQDHHSNSVDKWDAIWSAMIAASPTGGE